MPFKLPDFTAVGMDDPRAVGGLPSFPQEDPGAQGLGVLGKGVQAVGGALEDFAAEEQRKRDKVNEALATADYTGNSIRIKEAMKVERDPAKLDALRAQLGEARDSAAQTIGNPFRRQLWSAIHSRDVAEGQAQADLHQHAIYNDKFLAGADAQLADKARLAATATDPADREAAQRSVGEIIGGLIGAGVISETKGQELIKANGQRIITDRVHWLDANDQPGAALEYLRQNQQHVDPQVLDSLVGPLRNKKNKADGEAASYGVWPNGAAPPMRAPGASKAIAAPTPEAGALLDTIAGPESEGAAAKLGVSAYNVRYTPSGGAAFDSLAQHPNIREAATGGASDAAGRYQFLSSTFKPIAADLGLTDFSPKTQDTAAWALAQQVYQTKTGRDLQGDLEKGDVSRVADALHSTWPTFTAASATKLAVALRQKGSADQVADASGAAMPSDMWLRQEYADVVAKFNASESALRAKDTAYDKQEPQSKPESFGDWKARVHPDAAGVPSTAKAPAPSVATLAPDLDSMISAIHSDPNLSPEARDHAETFTTARYHRWMAATNSERATLVKTLNDGVAALADGKDWSPDMGAIKRLLPPVQADEALNKVDLARVAGSAKTKVWNASPQDNDAAWADIQRGLNDPQSADYAKKRTYADAFLKAVKERDDSLKADPAQFVAVSPTVSTARAAIDNNNPTHGTEAMIRASLAEQSRLGVRPEDQRTLTKGQAQELVTRIISADPAKIDIGMALSQQAKDFGSYWPQVFGDLVKGGLPPIAQTIAAMDTPEQAAPRADFQRMLKVAAEKGGVAKLKEAAPQADAKLIDQGVDDTLADFRASSRDVNLYDAVKDSTKNLAYYYAYNGQDGAKALASAYAGIIGSKYDFDGPLRVPKGKLGEIEAAASVVRDGVKPADLGDVPGNPNLTPERRQQIYAEALPRGRWLTNERDDGAVLMLPLRNGAEIVARRGDGQRIEFKFSDAPELAKSAPAPPAQYMPPF